MMNYFKMIVFEIVVFKNFEIFCYILNFSYFMLFIYFIVFVLQGDFFY